ncbi:MAG: Holliday junction resolvase RuvX [Ideonella sp.]|nr:Holliday junction resolvase RuvX [Ideonella sp.]MCC7456837.1 Holliday junction resolvase RuvX [Nitrospira sp.]
MSAATASSASRPPLSFLAFDYGTRRVGVAVGNTLLAAAQPLATIAAMGDARFEAIGKLVHEWRPAALVVGVPTHPDGAPHENTRRAQAFARRLHGRFGLPVHEVDERYTTVEALARHARDVDAAAAALILEQFLHDRSLHSRT